MDIINAETKALHHSAFLFFQRKEVKDKLHHLLGKFAMFLRLTVGKLTTVSTQKNVNYNLPLETKSDVEQGFVEIFCKLFRLREKLKRIRMEVDEKEYTLSYSSMMGHIVFNSTVFWKCYYFEKLFKPVVGNPYESKFQMHIICSFILR